MTYGLMGGPNRRSMSRSRFSLVPGAGWPSADETLTWTWWLPSVIASAGSWNTKLSARLHEATLSPDLPFERGTVMVWALSGPTVAELPTMDKDACTVGNTPALSGFPRTVTRT